VLGAPDRSPGSSIHEGLSRQTALLPSSHSA
jgi:hypothetical protein